MTYDDRLKEEAKMLAHAEHRQANTKGVAVPAGVKHDAGKPPLGLLPRSALEAVARVLAFGAAKYGRWNWRAGMAWTRVSDAALRHLTAWIDGENTDPETDESHLAHAACCLLFLLTYQREGLGTDDRFCPASKTTEPAPVPETVTGHDPGDESRECEIAGCRRPEGHFGPHDWACGNRLHADDIAGCSQPRGHKAACR